MLLLRGLLTPLEPWDPWAWGACGLLLCLPSAGAARFAVSLSQRGLSPPRARAPLPERGGQMRSSALTRELCVWRCDLAARRPGRPLGVRAPRPDWPTARQEGGWAAAVPSSRRRSGCPQGGLLRSPLDLAAASLSNSLHPAQPRAGAAPRGAESRRRWDCVLAAHPAGSAWCPRVNAIPSAQEERAGGRRAGGE